MVESKRPGVDSTTLTDDDVRALKAILETQQRNGGAVPRIAPHNCAEIRARLGDGETAEGIAGDYGVVAETVRYHAHGSCTHRVDEPPRRNNGGYWVAQAHSDGYRREDEP